jgi:transcriptional regulator with XRE-family HTH domain
MDEETSLQARVLQLLATLEALIIRLGRGKGRIKPGNLGFESPGQLLRQIRGLLGLSPSEFAACINVTEMAVTKWEVDQSYPRPKSLKGLYAYLQQDQKDVTAEPFVTPWQLQDEIPQAHLRLLARVPNPKYWMLQAMREYDEVKGPLSPEREHDYLLVLWAHPMNRQPGLNTC